MVSDGIDPTARYRIAVEITIAGSEITFDFSRDRRPGAGLHEHAARLGARRDPHRVPDAAARRRDDVPTNHGLFAPVKTVFRKGSLIAPRFPASTIFGNQMCDEVVEAIMRALAELLPDRVTAGWNQFLCTALTAIDPRTGQPSVSLSIFLRGGPGAMRGADGFDALGFSGTPGRCARPTWRCSSSRRRTSWSTTSTCPTRPARAAGAAASARPRAGASTARASSGCRSATTPRARAPSRRRASSAARPAGLNDLELHFPDGSVRNWGSKEIVHDIPAGTICVARNGGGGGYGAPARTRQPQTRARRGARRPRLAREGARELRRRGAARLSGIDAAETARLRGAGA